MTGLSTSIGIGAHPPFVKTKMNGSVHLTISFRSGNNLNFLFWNALHPVPQCVSIISVSPPAFVFRLLQFDSSNGEIYGATGK